MNDIIDIGLMTDQEIVSEILKRNASVTKKYFFEKCAPLFRSKYRDYYTECDNWMEFATEIYLYIMIPQKRNKICKLASFGFRCTLTMWLQIVTENYCKQLFAKRKRDIYPEFIQLDDGLKPNDNTFEPDFQSLDMEDIICVLNMMPNQRYRTLIDFRHVGHHTDQETAEHLNMSMANYYNKHRLAKAQFIAALRKEGLL